MNLLHKPKVVALRIRFRKAVKKTFTAFREDLCNEGTILFILGLAVLIKVAFFSSVTWYGGLGLALLGILLILPRAAAWTFIYGSRP